MDGWRRKGARRGRKERTSRGEEGRRRMEGWERKRSRKGPSAGSPTEG